MLNDHFVMETFRIVPIIATKNIGIDNPAKVSNSNEKNFFSSNSHFSKKNIFPTISTSLSLYCKIKYFLLKLGPKLVRAANLRKNGMC